MRKVHLAFWAMIIMLLIPSMIALDGAVNATVLPTPTPAPYCGEPPHDSAAWWWTCKDGKIFYPRVYIPLAANLVEPFAKCEGWRDCDPSFIAKIPDGYYAYKIEIQVGDEVYTGIYNPDNGTIYADCGIAWYCFLWNDGWAGGFRETSHQPLAIDVVRIYVLPKGD